MSSSFTIISSQYSVKTVESIVGMAVYHKDDCLWIKQSVDSILNQIYTDFLFVIVIDGEVPNGIYDLLLNYANQDYRVVLVQSDANNGLAASMNFVIDWSLSLKPKYFFRMDADDVSLPDRLQKQREFLQNNQEVSILGTALTEINEENVPVGARLLPLTNNQIVRLLPRRCTINHPTVCIRFDVFAKGHRYDPSLKNTQDYFLWIQLAAAGYKFNNLKCRLLNFRRVNDFYKRRGFTKSINECRARFLAMRRLKRMSFYNVFYALSVFAVRLLPPNVVKMAYKVDRHLLEKYFKQ